MKSIYDKKRLLITGGTATRKIFFEYCNFGIKTLNH